MIDVREDQQVERQVIERRRFLRDAAVIAAGAPMILSLAASEASAGTTGCVPAGSTTRCDNAPPPGCCAPGTCSGSGSGSRCCIALNLACSTTSQCCPVNNTGANIICGGAVPRCCYKTGVVPVGGLANCCNVTLSGTTCA
jgi:hypothetical protein